MISLRVNQITGRTIGRKNALLGRVLENWTEIVGADLADKAQPLKISARRGPDGPSATLEIAASSADATALHYRKDLILERLNFILGQRHIAAIKFVHAAINSNAPVLKRPSTPLTDGEKTRVSAELHTIEDNALRDVLTRFGEALLKDQKNNKP